MPINTPELLSAIRQLAEEENINVTVKQSFKGAGFAFAGAFVGGILGGPVGLGIGGTVGSIWGATQGSGKYKSVALIIRDDMTGAQKERLVTSLKRALENVRIEDGIMILPLILNDPSLRQLMITETVKFIQNELQYQLAAP